MRRTNQGGSLAGFIIIGVLLTLVLVGGLYGLNRYNAERSGGEETAVEEPNPSEEATDTGDASTNPEEGQSAQQSRIEEPSAGGDSQTQTQAPVAPSGEQSASQLPQTGPADALLSVLAVVLLTFAGVHYARSRTTS